MKEHLKECLRNFFIIVTLINLAMFVLGSILASDQRFGYEVFLYPIIYGILGSIPNLIIVSKRELTPGQFLIRETLEMLLIAAIIITFMFAGTPLNSGTLMKAACVFVSVVLIFIMVNVITWILDSKTAKSMTEDLKAFQSMNNSDKQIMADNE